MNAQPTSPRDLLRVDPKERGQYGHFSLVHLTAYSVNWLVAWGIPTTYENISVLNARLFPFDFSMKGFPELPDGLRTNRSLLQMRPKYRGFATSDPRRGVHLTEKGRSEVIRMLKDIGSPTFEGKPVPVEPSVVDPRRPNKARERTRNPIQELADARSRLLYRRYRDNKLEDTDVVHLLGLLNVYDHTPPIEVRKAYRELKNTAASLGDTDFVQFLDAVQAKFQAYLARADRPPRKE